MTHTSYVTVTDQFCGAGGSSIGATAAGAELKLALNHWKLAIETHNSNFPDADHDCTDVSACDPRRYRSTDILITSPECFVAGTLVLTDRGLIPIEDVLLGDLALTHRNRWRRVVRTQHQIADTVIVKGQGNTAGIEVTPNHRFWVRSQTRVWDNEKRDYNRRVYGEPGWEHVEKLRDMTYRWATPTTIEPLPAVSLPTGGLGCEAVRAWWIIGRWLGDGSLTFGKNAEVVISCGYQDVEVLGAALEATGENWRPYEKRTAVNFTLWSPLLREWLDTYFGHGAAAKRLPGWVYGLPEAERQALLDGYISADGHRDNRRTRADTISKALAVGMRLLAEGLGYRAGYYRYEQHANVIEGRLVNVLPIHTVAWENNASTRTAFEDEGQSWGLVKSILPGRTGVTVYNLEVEEDHSYIADGIVVANCTNHSLAKGKMRKWRSQLDMFGKLDIDPAEERSRATMWDVCRFAEAHRYRIVIVENVVEARWWEPFEAWLQAMALLGYKHKIVYLNSMFAHPTPQSRDRMYVVFWHKSLREPDLDIRPEAYCAQCGCNVNAVQSWKNPAKKWGKYKQQYIYCCPTCAEEVTPYYFCAFNAIDWSLPAPRIGDRSKPLKEKTRKRIQIGLEKFGRQPVMVDYVHTSRQDRHQDMVWTVDRPQRTQLGIHTHALVTPPFVVQTSHPEGDGTTKQWPLTRGLPTQSARAELGMVVPPYLLSLNHSDVARLGDITDPTPTVMPGARPSLVVPPYLVDLRGANAPREVIDVLSTVCGSGNHHGLVYPPFLTSYNSTSQGSGVDEPVPTQDTRDRHGVVVPPCIVSYYTRLAGQQAAVSSLDEATPTVPGRAVHYLAQPGDTPSVDDCGFRMLQPHEIGKAMAFPGTYIVVGTQRERVKQYGNAVTPPVMRLLMERVLAILG